MGILVLGGVETQVPWVKVLLDTTEVVWDAARASRLILTNIEFDSIPSDPQENVECFYFLLFFALARAADDQQRVANMAVCPSSFES